MAKSDFISQLHALSYKVEELTSEFVTIDYEIPLGKFQGQNVTMAFQVDDSFPMTPPPGPHFKPLLLPITGGSDAHPFGAIHSSALGTDWEYWSRPFKDWNRTDKTVRTYLAHIKNLLATIP